MFTKAQLSHNDLAGDNGPLPGREVRVGRGLASQELMLRGCGHLPPHPHLQHQGRPVGGRCAGRKRRACARLQVHEVTLHTLRPRSPPRPRGVLPPRKRKYADRGPASWCPLPCVRNTWSVAATALCPEQEAGHVLEESQAAGTPMFAERACPSAILLAAVRTGGPTLAVRPSSGARLLADSAQKTPSATPAAWTSCGGDTQPQRAEGRRHPSPGQIVGGLPVIPRHPLRDSGRHPHLVRVLWQRQVLALGSQTSRDCADRDAPQDRFPGRLRTCLPGRSVDVRPCLPIVISASQR